jgi:molybdopterin-binding protein
MEISARNQLKGRIKTLRTGEIMAEVVVVLADGQEITSVITRGAVEHLHLQVGDNVTVIVKSTEVMVGKG